MGSYWSIRDLAMGFLWSHILNSLLKPIGLLVFNGSIVHWLLLVNQ